MIPDPRVLNCIVGKEFKSKSRMWIVPLTIFLDFIDGEDKIQEIFDSVDENHDEVNNLESVGIYRYVYI